MRFLYVEDSVFPEARNWAERLAKTMEREFEVVSADKLNSSPKVWGGASPRRNGESGFRLEGQPLARWSMDDLDADFLFYATASRRRSIQHWLNISRELRIPYIFLTPQMRFPAESVLANVLAPVTMLEEEVHKAELLSHLARYTDTAITLLTAHDYGSRARTNTGKIRTFLESRQADLGKQFVIHEQTAKADSMALYKEVPAVRDCDLIVWTASRDYGLDDLIFGPAEQKLILHSVVPVALLNPRGDLYSLCD